MMVSGEGQDQIETTREATLSDCNFWVSRNERFDQKDVFSHHYSSLSTATYPQQIAQKEVANKMESIRDNQVDTAREEPNKILPS